jgi:hypothetical protein
MQGCSEGGEEDQMKNEEIKSKLTSIARLCMIHDNDTGYFKSPCPYEINKIVMETLNVIKEENDEHP